MLLDAREDGGPGSHRNTHTGNVVQHSGGDGIHIGQALNELTVNRAHHNARRGIDAAAGTIDGGGDRASGNGRSPQCVGGDLPIGGRA